MKKFTLVSSMFLLLGSSVFAQLRPIAQEIANLTAQKQTFQKVSLFEKQERPEKKNEVKDAQFLKLDIKSLNSLAKNASNNLEFSVPYNNTNIVLELTETKNLLDQSFYVTDENFKPQTYNPGKYYQGIIKGDNNSLVTISLFEDEVIGIISSESFGNLNLGALTDAKGNMIAKSTEYVLYSDRNLPADELGTFCGADRLVENEDKGLDLDNPNRGKAENLKTPTIYFEIDYNIYQFRGRNIETVMNWLTAQFNFTKTIYQNDDISVALRSTMVWTSSDPYQNVGTNSEVYLNKFRKTRGSFDADLGQLIGVDPGPLGGIAWVSALCSGNNYSYSDVNHTYEDYPTYSWNIMVITHELGHNLGSRHTQACAWNGDNTAIDGCVAVEGNCARPGLPEEGGTIMSYCHMASVGTNLTNGFGPQPRQRIIDFINSTSCLFDTLGDEYITYHPYYEVTDVTETSAKLDITLTNEQVVSWDYKLSRYNQPIPTAWSNLDNSNSFVFTDLVPNTYYRLRIKKSNDDRSINRNGVDLVFATSGDFCSNELQFVDFGGPNTNYIAMENWTRTLLPSNPSDKIKVDFVSFNTESGNDILRVYDGVNTEATQLTPTAGLSGNITSDLPSYEATNEEGALTFKFVSDAFTNAAGWVANVSCKTLGLEENGQLVDFSYYPNPVTNDLNLTAKSPFSSIEIYSLDGKKVASKTYKNVFATKVSMEHLPKGVYLVKVKFEKKESTFKVVKK